MPIYPEEMHPRRYSPLSQVVQRLLPENEEPPLGTTQLSELPRAMQNGPRQWLGELPWLVDHGSRVICHEIYYAKRNRLVTSDALWRGCGAVFALSDLSCQMTCPTWIPSSCTLCFFSCSHPVVGTQREMYDHVCF